MTQIIKICEPTIPDIINSDKEISVYLDLSKQTSGDGSFENMYCWEDILYLLSTVDLGKIVKIWTIGSNMSLINNSNKISIKDKAFAKTVGQRFEFLPYRTEEYNVPFIGHGVPPLHTEPFIDLEGVSGLTLYINRFRFSLAYKSLLHLKNCSNIKILITNCGFSVNAIELINSLGGIIFDIEDCNRLEVLFLHNGITDASVYKPMGEIATIYETHEEHSKVENSGMFDQGLEFDAGRHFDTINSNTINKFIIENNYVSYMSGTYSFFKTDNYHTRIRKQGNKYRIVV